MKNTFGQSVSVTLFGESHGPYIGAVLDGLAPGIYLNKAFITEQLNKRKPIGKISTSRREKDDFQIISGVFNDRTTGTPICILIPNNDTKSGDYKKTKNLMRPSHADYTAECKYHGYQDYRGGGHFSGRITAALVAVGSIALLALKNKGIIIGSHMKKCAGIRDREFINIREDIEKLNSMDFAVLDNNQAQQMKRQIEKAAEEGDSVGGVLETAILGLPKGVGEPWMDSFESIISHGLFSIPAVKGVEFGKGFGFADMRASQANDPFEIKNGNIVTSTNNNGGINGGITNGMPVIFSCVVKPTPSIFKEQKTVDISKNQNTNLSIKGRHDPAIIHRARVVVDSVVAIALCDILSLRFGTDYFYRTKKKIF